MKKAQISYSCKQNELIIKQRKKESVIQIIFPLLFLIFSCLPFKTILYYYYYESEDGRNKNG